MAGLAALVACASPPTVSAPKTAPRRVGVVEGYVLDSETNAPLPGADIDLGPGLTITDEHGYYRVELDPGHDRAFAGVGTATSDIVPVDINEGRVTRLDFRLDHAELVTSLQDDPPVSCPSSAPGAVIEGHTTSQADIDSIARSVLQRFVADRSTMASHGLRLDNTVYVQVELEHHHRISASAFPSVAGRRFVARTRAELQDEAERTGKEVRFIDIWRIYSDGTCGMVWVGLDYVIPKKDEHGRLCCCTGTEVFEKHGESWDFVRRAMEICA